MFRFVKQPIKEFLYRIRGEYTTERLLTMGLRIGRNFNRLNGVILDPAHCWLISIGDNVTLAPRVHVLAHDASTCMHLGYAKIGRVVIGSNVFIGAESVILPNITIGDNVIVGANSTVTEDIPSNSVAMGSPARVLCSLKDYIERHRQLMSTRPCYGEEYTTRKNVGSQKKKIMNQQLKDGIGFVV